MEIKTILYILIIIVILYSLCYLNFPEEVSILQTKLHNFNFNQLLSRQPLIIEDKIINISEILKLWFKPNIISYNKKLKDIWVRNRYKYLYIYAKKDISIYISKPKKIKTEVPDNNEMLIEIKLKGNQSLILPYKWYYSIENNEDIDIYGIDDYITYLLSFIF